MTVANRASELIEQAEQVANDLVAYLQALPAAEWNRPSDCEGWSVADVVAHLALVEVLLSGSITRGIKGDGGPPPEAAAGVEAWREHRNRERTRLTGLPPGELLGQLKASFEKMRAPLASLAAADASDLQGWHPAGAQPLSWFPGQWLVELSLHDWDIRVSGDPSAAVHRAAQAGLGLEMRSRLPRCFRAERAADLHGVVRIDLSGPAPTAWLVRLADAAVEVLDDGAAQPDATIHTEPGTYALVQTSRRPAEFFKPNGRWRVAGNVSLADGLAGALSG